VASGQESLLDSGGQRNVDKEGTWMTRVRIGPGCAAALLLLSVGTAIGAQTEAGAKGPPPKELSVQVETAPVREKPDWLGKVLEPLPYGTRVSVVGQRGDLWMQVAGRGEEGAPPPRAGWMSKSHLTAMKLARVPGAGGQGSFGVSDEEVALAGKGFDEDVEKAYRTGKPGLSRAYSVLDELEKKKPAPEAVARFREQGQLEERSS